MVDVVVVGSIVVVVGALVVVGNTVDSAFRDVVLVCDVVTGKIQASDPTHSCEALLHNNDPSGHLQPG